MNKNLTIETPRLLLTPFSEKHLSEEYVAWLNDPEVVKYSELRHRNHSLSSCQGYVDSFRDSDHFFWAIMLKAYADLHVGNITAHIDSPNKVADIGILIGNKKYWGKGIGLEAWTAVFEFLWKQDIRKITAGAFVSNIGMVEIMRRSGMREDGIRQQQFLDRNEAVDLVHYCIFREGNRR